MRKFSGQIKKGHETKISTLQIKKIKKKLLSNTQRSPEVTNPLVIKA